MNWWILLNNSKIFFDNLTKIADLVNNIMKENGFIPAIKGFS